MKNTNSSIFCADSNCKDKPLVCKLSTPELQQRNATVLASLQQKMLGKKELDNGYAFKFSGTDSTIDQLTEFIKTEKQCCDFFTFAITLPTDSTAWLQLTGPEGTKGFIKEELGW